MEPYYTQDIRKNRWVDMWGFTWDDWESKDCCLLIGASPDEVTVHGAVLQLAGGDAVQMASQCGTIIGVGAVGLHAANRRPHKAPQGGLSPATYHPVPAGQQLRIISCGCWQVWYLVCSAL